MFDLYFPLQWYLKILIPKQDWDKNSIYKKKKKGIYSGLLINSVYESTTNAILSLHSAQNKEKYLYLCLYFFYIRDCFLLYQTFTQDLIQVSTLLEQIPECLNPQRSLLWICLMTYLNCLVNNPMCWTSSKMASKDPPSDIHTLL